jgi:hypothetical protein
MKKALLSLLLACFMASCQSHDPRIPLFEARQDRPISVTLKTGDKTDLKVWNSCHTRRVWFDVKDSRGRKLPEQLLPLVDVFWSEKVAESPIHDATAFKVHVENGLPVQGAGVTTPFYYIGKGSLMLFGQCIEKPGTYLLEFHVDCYDQKHRMVYSSEAERIRVHIAHRTFLEKPTSKEASDITLWVHPKRKL